MQKLLRKQENWFSLQVANPFWQLEMLPTCSPWQRPEWPPAAIGVFGLEVVFLFFPSTFKETLQHYMNLIRNLQNDPENSEKSALRHFFTSSSNFWCIGVCGSSSAKRRTESSLAEKESLTCSCLMENSIISWSTTHTPWRLLDPSFPILMLTSEIHAPSFLVVMFGSHVPMGTEM